MKNNYTLIDYKNATIHWDVFGSEYSDMVCSMVLFLYILCYWFLKKLMILSYLVNLYLIMIFI